MERKAWIAGLLEPRTGQDLVSRNVRVRGLDPADEPTLRACLAEQDVTGYQRNSSSWPPSASMCRRKVVDEHKVDRLYSGL